jgi:hypothetical protein
MSNSYTDDPILDYEARMQLFRDYLIKLHQFETLHDRFALTGSLVTQYYLAKHYKPEQIRKSKDIDLLYLMPEDNVTMDQAKDYPIKKLTMKNYADTVLDEYEEEFDEKFWDFHFELKYSAEKDYTKCGKFTYYDDEWKVTFPEEPFPGYKCILEVETPAYNTFQFAMDVSTGNRYIDLKEVPIVELIPIDVYPLPEPLLDQDLERYENVTAKMVTLEMLCAYKLHSAFECNNWRPKDTYDLCLLLPLVNDDLTPHVRVAFGSRGDDPKELLPLHYSKTMLNRLHWDDMLQEEELGTEFKNVEDVIELLHRELARLVPSMVPL